MQFPLLYTQDFNPLSQGPGHYVAALQNKSGELSALAECSTETWGRLTPLLQVVGPKDQQKPLTATSVQGWVKRIARAVGERPCYLDIVRLKASRPTVPNNVPVLDFMYQQSRKRKLTFVPVLPLANFSDSHLEQVRNAVLEDGRGVALRYPAFGTVGLVSPAELLTRTLESLETPASSVDLIVDIKCLSPDAEVDAEDLALLVGYLANAAPWRNMILMGTSIPKTLSSIKEGTLGSLPRHEWTLWKSLRGENDLAGLTFGDYAVQHPDPPQEDNGPEMGMRANIRYTIQSDTLIARGKGAVIQEGKGQYVELCGQLCGHQEYSGPEYTWGDRMIRSCADGLRPPGSQNMWRGVGTSHHLRFVTDQIAQHLSAVQA
jgi:hypothetical protein